MIWKQVALVTLQTIAQSVLTRRRYCDKLSHCCAMMALMIGRWIATIARNIPNLDYLPQRLKDTKKIDFFHLVDSIK